MNANQSLIEALLYEEESQSLDFKSEQYKFTKATDEEKGELLKDILAFANAWRRIDAYILIGFEENKGGRCHVKGISEQLDDASLQQFVNSKTNRPISFSYQNLSCEGQDVALIVIPVQDRPIYLNKDYGKLKNEKVYIRRGSSTDIAKPDETAKMSSVLGNQSRTPDMEVFFSIPESRRDLGRKIEIESLLLEVPRPSEIPSYTKKVPAHHPLLMSPLRKTNDRYYRQLVDFTYIHNLYKPVCLALRNNGSGSATDIRLECRIEKMGNKIVAVDRYSFPDIPQSEHQVDTLLYSRDSPFANVPEIKVKVVDDWWMVETSILQILPKDCCWIEYPFYLGANSDCELEIEFLIYADELSYPQHQELTIVFKCERRKVDLEDIIELEEQRFTGTKFFKEYLKEHLERQNED